MTDADPPARAPRSRRRKLALGLATSLGALGALAVLGEMTLRAYHLVRRTPPDLNQRDARLGWRPTPGLSLDRALKDGAGAPYTARVTQDADGFRLAGAAVKGARPRLLVVGDSFTQAVDADDRDVYYARLGRALDVEVFAVGGGGWGSLQECLLLEDVVARIEPDLVLWQFCSNDIINNDPELERGSCCNNNGVRRPYLDVDGAVRYVTPKPAAWLWDLRAHSRLVRFVLDRWLRSGPRWGGCVEDEIEREGAGHPGFRRAVNVTRAILERARRACGDAPLVAFSVDAREPYLGELEAICAALGVSFVDGVGEAIAEAKRAGRTVVAEDGAHWNALGHELAAEVLVQALRGLPALRAR